MTALPPSLLDYATRKNAELIQLGVEPSNLSGERMRRTGHPRRISPRWAPSIGMWGGVQSMRDIAAACGATFAQTHAWAQYRHLRTRTRARQRSQALLAIHALATPGPARTVASLLGILPVEVCLYRAAAELLRVEAQVTLREVLGWDAVRLERTWDSLGLCVEHERPSPPSPREQIARAFARRTDTVVLPTHIARALAIAERELPGLLAEEPNVTPSCVSRIDHGNIRADGSANQVDQNLL
jgi:hypothetical protein